MDENYILQKLQTMMDERGWSYYKLAKEADMPISTVRNIFRNSYCPSFVTLLKICDGLGITLSQFFMDEQNYVELSPEQKELLSIYDLLTSHQKETVKAFIKGMLLSK